MQSHTVSSGSQINDWTWNTKEDKTRAKELFEKDIDNKKPKEIRDKIKNEILSVLDRPGSFTPLFRPLKKLYNINMLATQIITPAIKITKKPEISLNGVDLSFAGVVEKR